MSISFHDGVFPYFFSFLSSFARRILNPTPRGVVVGRSVINQNPCIELGPYPFQDTTPTQGIARGAIGPFWSRALHRRIGCQVETNQSRFDI